MSRPPSGRVTPVTVCETIGQGRIMQCVRPGYPWPDHLKDNPPAVEPRCAACDEIKRKMGVLDRVIAEWEARAALARSPGGT